MKAVFFVFALICLAAARNCGTSIGQGCSNGKCCSYWGFCGTGSAYCGSGKTQCACDCNGSKPCVSSSASYAALAVTVTATGQRAKVVSIMQSWVGITKGSSGHQNIINLYNDIRPLPVGFKMNTSLAWCATTVSAAFHKAGLDSIFAPECSCGRMVDDAKKKGIWQENDAYVPKPGDCVLYNWSDTTGSSSDNYSWPDHVGMVEKVSGNQITVIEGNYGGKVARRTISVNQRYIRGYVTPNFSS